MAIDFTQRFVPDEKTKDKPKKGKTSTTDITTNSTIDNNGASPIVSNVDSNSNNDNGITIYKKAIQKKAKKPTAAELRKQQNVYIDNNLVDAIEKILSNQTNLQKKDIYNAALQMYLQYAFDMKVELLEDQY